MTQVYAIADLHLSFARPKPMSKFGQAWTDFYIESSEAWTETVTDDDIVLVAGDISWALKPLDPWPISTGSASFPERRCSSRETTTGGGSRGTMRHGF